MGFSPTDIVDALAAKQELNESREWPDWRGIPEDEVIEHTKDRCPYNHQAWGARCKLYVGHDGVCESDKHDFKVSWDQKMVGDEPLPAETESTRPNRVEELEERLKWLERLRAQVA